MNTNVNTGDSLKSLARLYGSRQDSAENQFFQWCDDNGVCAPKLQPFQWVRGNSPHKSLTNKSLSIMQKTDCIFAIDHSTGERYKFFDNTNKSSTKDRQEIQRISQLAKQQTQAMHDAAAQLADKLLSESIQASVSGYFLKKELSDTHGAMWNERLNCWLVRCTDIDGNTLTIQKIFNRPAPNKFYLEGGRTKGAMVIRGDLETGHRVLISEGFSTACSLREETSETVIAALSCHNLKPVCEAVRERYPDIKIIVCGDDDRLSEHNAGRICAEDAARTVSGKSCFPTFCDGCTGGCSDFNDALRCKANREARS